MLCYLLTNSSRSFPSARQTYIMNIQQGSLHRARQKYISWFMNIQQGNLHRARQKYISWFMNIQQGSLHRARQKYTVGASYMHIAWLHILPFCIGLCRSRFCNTVFNGYQFRSIAYRLHAYFALVQKFFWSEHALLLCVNSLRLTAFYQNCFFWNTNNTYVDGQCN